MISFWQLIGLLAITNIITGITVGLSSKGSKVKIKRNTLSDNASITSVGRIKKLLRRKNKPV